MAMDELTNRSRSYAEAAVTMVWLVLIAPALKGKREVPGVDVSKYVIILAFPTIIIGIGPLLLCCCFNNKHAYSDVSALLSAAMLLALACWIATLTIGVPFVLIVAGLSLGFTVLHAMYYAGKKKDPKHKERTKEFYTILDGSHEFVCCMTGIHFVWLGSLALEGQISKSHALSVPIGIGNISICAICLFALIFEMTPPLKYSTIGDIAVLLSWFDAIMVATIGIILEAAMVKSLVLPDDWLMLVLFIPLVIIGPSIVLLVFLLDITVPEEATTGYQDNEAPKLAPLGLTKLMVTGFLTVSVSVNSTDRSIANHWFQVLAAAAILSGLTWRVLTQAQVKVTQETKETTVVTQEPLTQDENNSSTSASQARIDKAAAIASSAKTACFFAHIFVALATMLLMIERYIVNRPASVAALAPAPSRY